MIYIHSEPFPVYRQAISLTSLIDSFQTVVMHKHITPPPFFDFFEFYHYYQVTAASTESTVRFSFQHRELKCPLSYCSKISKELPKRLPVVSYDVTVSKRRPCTTILHHHHSSISSDSSTSLLQQHSKNCRFSLQHREIKCPLSYCSKISRELLKRSPVVSY